VKRKCNSSAIKVVVEQEEEKLRIAASYLPHFFTLHVQKERKASSCNYLGQGLQLTPLCPGQLPSMKTKEMRFCERAKVRLWHNDRRYEII